MNCRQMKAAVRTKSPIEMTRAERAVIFRHLDGCRRCRDLVRGGRIKCKSSSPGMTASEIAAMYARDLADPEYRKAANIPDLPGGPPGSAVHEMDLVPAVLARADEVHWGQELMVLLQCGFHDSADQVMPTVVYFNSPNPMTRVAVSYKCPVCGNGVFDLMSRSEYGRSGAEQDRHTPGYSDFLTANLGKCFAAEGGIMPAFEKYAAPGPTLTTTTPTPPNPETPPHESESESQSPDLKKFDPKWFGDTRDKPENN